MKHEKFLRLHVIPILHALANGRHGGRLVRPSNGFCVWRTGSGSNNAAVKSSEVGYINKYIRDNYPECFTFAKIVIVEYLRGVEAKLPLEEQFVALQIKIAELLVKGH